MNSAINIISNLVIAQGGNHSDSGPGCDVDKSVNVSGVNDKLNSNGNEGKMLYNCDNSLNTAMTMTITDDKSENVVSLDNNPHVANDSYESKKDIATHNIGFLVNNLIAGINVNDNNSQTKKVTWENKMLYFNDYAFNPVLNSNRELNSGRCYKSNNIVYNDRYVKYLCDQDYDRYKYRYRAYKNHRQRSNSQTPRDVDKNINYRNKMLFNDSVISSTSTNNRDNKCSNTCNVQKSDIIDDNSCRKIVRNTDFNKREISDHMPASNRDNQACNSRNENRNVADKKISLNLNKNKQQKDVLQSVDKTAFSPDENNTRGLKHNVELPKVTKANQQIKYVSGRKCEIQCQKKNKQCKIPKPFDPDKKRLKITKALLKELKFVVEYMVDSDCVQSNVTKSSGNNDNSGDIKKSVNTNSDIKNTVPVPNESKLSKKPNKKCHKVDKAHIPIENREINNGHSKLNTKMRKRVEFLYNKYNHFNADMCWHQKCGPDENNTKTNNNHEELPKSTEKYQPMKHIHSADKEQGKPCKNKTNQHKSVTKPKAYNVKKAEYLCFKPTQTNNTYKIANTSLKELEQTSSEHMLDPDRSDGMDSVENNDMITLMNDRYKIANGLLKELKQTSSEHILDSDKSDGMDSVTNNDIITPINNSYKIANASLNKLDQTSSEQMLDSERSDVLDSVWNNDQCHASDNNNIPNVQDDNHISNVMNIKNNIQCNTFVKNEMPSCTITPDIKDNIRNSTHCPTAQGNVDDTKHQYSRNTKISVQMNNAINTMVTVNNPSKIEVLSVTDNNIKPNNNSNKRHHTINVNLFDSDSEVNNINVSVTSDTNKTVLSVINGVNNCQKRMKYLDQGVTYQNKYDTMNNIDESVCSVVDLSDYSNDTNNSELSHDNNNYKRSSTSINTSMSKEKMPTISKKDRRRSLKQHKKRQNSINKLFDHLRDVSQSTTQNEESVIELDDTQNTVIEVKAGNAQDSLIIIPDDDVQSSTPKRTGSLHHSTPKKTIDDLILSQSNNLLQLNNANVTRQINRDSYLTIDLTAESNLSRTEPTVIDLETTVDNDVTLVEASNASSMSGDSQVTILRQPVSRKLRKFTNGIANLNASEKGKLLELITQTIFNGCDVPDNVQTNIQKSLPRALETAEDTYIKDVILGRKASRNSVGSNVYHPDRQTIVKTGPRMVVIDGSNVAMEHGRGKLFSVRGLQICIDYFLRKGHVVKAFVPRFRCKYGMSTDGRLLDYLERKGFVIYTPSREIKGRTVTSYDDRYILQCAAEFDGVIVSGDHYRDLINENAKWRFVIENRVLPFTWVNDMIMFPKDPYGRAGPSLAQLLWH